VIVFTLLLKKSAKVDACLLGFCLILFRKSVSGKFCVFRSFALFTASQRDFELPGIIVFQMFFALVL
jgi:hypothetical protein